jgi:hypothetical protein
MHAWLLKICDNQYEEPNFQGGRALRQKRGSSSCPAKVQAAENRAITPGSWQSPLSKFIPLAPDAIFWNNRLLRSPLGP